MSRNRQFLAGWIACITRSVACGSAVVGLLVAASAQGGVLAVDDAGTARSGKVGHFSSLVASGNEVAVSYYCEQDLSGPFPTQYSIRFAWKSGDCWQWTNLGEIGSYSSLKRDTLGEYHLLFSGLNGVAWAHGSGRTWTVLPERVDTGVSPAQVSLALDAANRPHVAYFDDGGNRALRYTWWNGSAWMRGPEEIIAANIWTPTIMPGCNFFALDSAGTPYVAFAQPSDAVNAAGDIKLASLQGGVWTIDSLNMVGVNPSLAIGTDNVPRLAFASADSVIYAFKSGGQWQFETVATGPTGISNLNSVSLAFGPGDSPAVCFGMTTSEDMYLATRGPGGWSAQVVDGDGSGSGDLILGRLGTGIAVDASGAPHVSYWAVTIQGTGHYSDLRYYTPGAAGTMCPEVPGACCDPVTYACTLATPSACAGAWQSAAACTPDPCNPSGACCAPDLTCTVVLRAECISGTWNGSPTCQPDPCNPSGACCDPVSGACSITTLSACTGAWNGSGSCAPNPCPQIEPTGVCCDTTGGGCTITLQSACSGTWLGAGSCSPSPCGGQGACCDGTECTLRIPDDCDGAAVYQGSGTTCGPVDNPTTCCPANFNRTSNVTVQDIFDYLAAYFAADTRADFNASGGVTVQDIFDFLAAYFAGCS